jgi:hypothetical protein
MRFAALGTLLVACTPAPRTPIPLLGAAGDVAALTGQWDGSYASATTGRSGSISFTLTTRGDSAYGDVVMIPRGFNRPLQAWNQPAGQAAAQPRSTVLTINFVRAAAGGGRVSGTLAPYADPETGAKLFTTFEGRLSQGGDTIAGTFTTRGGGASDGQTGEGR